MNNHTPGEWSIPHFALSDEHWKQSPSLMGGKPKGRCDCGYVLSEDVAIATVYYSKGPDDSNENPKFEEAKANAYLIATAPKLLEACETCLSVIESVSGADTDNRHAVMLRKVIAQAKGEHHE